MANRIVQAIYDLKDNVTGKLKQIGTALRGHSNDTEKSNKRISASFAAVSGAVKAFGAAVVAVVVTKGLGALRDGIIEVLQVGEKFDDLEKKFATAFGGIEEGAKAMQGVRDFADGVPQSFEDISEAAIKLKKFGFDPLDGSLQALVDNNNALDGSQQDLIATIDALGKANVRGQLNMRAIIALQQQGVPVVELLSKAYGRSADQIRQMASSGQLGADAIKLLISRLGELRAGAAAGELGDLDAQFTKLGDTLEGIYNDLAQGGPLDLARQQLVDLNAEVKRVSASPEFASLKESLTGAFEAGVDAVRKFADNVDLTKQIAQITVYTNALRDTFRILESSDAIIEPVFDGLSLLVEPFEKMKYAAGVGLTYVADKLGEISGKTKEVKQGFDDIAPSANKISTEVGLAQAAVEAFRRTVATVQNSEKNGLSVEAQAIADSLSNIVDREAAARKAIQGLFASIRTDDDTRLGDVALALAEIASQGGVAGKNVREGIAAELKKLSGEDLLRFQNASKTAFGQFDVSAEESSHILEATLGAALNRLGVQGDALGVSITENGRDIIATFETIATSVNATSSQIEAGFKAALQRITTSGEAEALGAVIEDAAKRGVVALDSTTRAAAALQAKLRELQEAADPLSDAFERLGITSQRELQNAADTAGEAFDVIVSGAQRGQAATEDVRRAFVAYAKAQLEAAENSTEWERKQVEGNLRVRAAALNVVDALGELGLAGEVAGDRVASGANRATQGLRGTEAAASGAAAAAGDLAASNVSVANTFVQVSNQAAITSGEIQGVSDKFKRLISDQQLYKGGGTQLFQDLNRQTGELEEQLRLIEEQNAAYDPLEQKVRDLRGQYELLGDEQLRRLAQAQMQLEENIKREQEAADAKRQALLEERKIQDDMRRAENAPRPTVSGAEIPIRIDLNLTNNQSSGVPSNMTQAQLDELARKLGPYVSEEVLRRIGRAGGGV